MQKLIVLFILIIIGCSRNVVEIQNRGTSPKKSANLYPIPASPQRKGDITKGKKYLLEGDYLDSGIPYDMMVNMKMVPKMDNILGRSGKNEFLPPFFTATEAANGTDIIAPNCLICHGAFLNNEYIIGLGNYGFDSTISGKFALNSLAFLVKSKYTDKSKEWEAFEQFYKGSLALAGNIDTKTVGANSADKIAEVLLAHREIKSLSWSDVPLLDITEFTVPADPPAWWLLKKKNAEFTTGIGRGDFARISTASSLLTMKNIDKVQEIDEKFTDIIAFINSLEAPEYPNQIDQNIADLGEIIFNKTCSKCHGNYGDNESYPNYIVHQNLIKTDPALAQSYHERQNFVDLYNDSWFGKGEYAASIIPSDGYVAPPLDGVWATAPYLHNGSVPNIAVLLDSKKRPTYWKRSKGKDTYDYDHIGWKYSMEESKKDKFTYDTTIKGYGNQGHYFGDKLSEKDRYAVLEYLKTL